MEDVKQYLHIGTTKSTFGVETDCLLFELENTERERVISNFQDMFCTSFSTLNKYQDAHPEYNFYKASCLFDPRQLSCISHDIDSFVAIKDSQDPSTDLLKEFQIHVNYQDDPTNLFNIPTFWNAKKSRFPLLEQIANKVIWMPVTSVEAKHSFS